MLLKLLLLKYCDSKLISPGTRSKLNFCSKYGIDFSEYCIVKTSLERYFCSHLWSELFLFHPQERRRGGCEGWPGDNYPRHQSGLWLVSPALFWPLIGQEVRGPLAGALVTLFTPWSVINTSDPGSPFSPERVIFIVMFSQADSGIYNYIYVKTEAKPGLRSWLEWNLCRGGFYVALYLIKQTSLEYKYTDCNFHNQSFYKIGQIVALLNIHRFNKLNASKPWVPFNLDNRIHLQ